MLTQNPVHPGDFKKFKVILNGKDISDVVHTVDIYQDIFASCNTAQFFCEDAADLLTTLPIKAGMDISITVETNFGGFLGDAEKKFDFKIYKIGDKVMENHKNQTYTLYAADRSFLENQKKRVRRSFRNQKPESIASALVSSELGGGMVDAHPSDTNVSVVIPAWTPFNACGWLTKVATSGNAADYCFFQLDMGKFAFWSFEKMYTGEKLPGTFKLRPAGQWEKGNYPEDFTFHIQQYAWDHFDGLAGMTAGLYKSKTVSFDFINKKWEEKTFNFGDDTPKDAEEKSFEEDMAGEETNISFIPKHEGMFDGGGSVLDTSGTWMGSRKSAIQKMDSERLTIQIGGAVKAWEWIGKACTVELPAQEDMSGEKLDKYRKGTYIVMAICHNIKKSAYMINMELCKKRLEKEK